MLWDGGVGVECLLEPSTCLFEQIRIWHPKKYDYQDCTLVIVFLGCQLA